MKYSHERLEKVINYFLDKPESSFLPFFIPNFESFQKAFHEEIGNIETYLTRQSMSIKNELTFKMLIHQYQAIIVSCLDKISGKQKEENNRDPKEVFQMAIEGLQKLFFFIRNRFQNFFNCDEKMPDIYLQEARQRIKARYKLLEKHLLKETVNKEIIQILDYPIKNFLNEGLNKKVSYRNLFYIEKFVDHCFNFKKKDATLNKNEDEAIIEFLVVINFNYTGMFSYIINRISNEINLIESMENKLEELHFFLKKFNQLPEKPGMYYNYKNACLKEQLTSWIKEEIEFIGKKYKKVCLLENGIDELPEEKLHLSISVDVLTLIARAAKDSKLLLNKHSTVMFRNISKYMRTKSSTNLSVNSMIKKSYEAERSSKETAIDVLHRMIKKIHEY